MLKEVFKRNLAFTGAYLISNLIETLTKSVLQFKEKPQLRNSPKKLCTCMFKIVIIKSVSEKRKQFFRIIKAPERNITEVMTLYDIISKNTLFNLCMHRLSLYTITMPNYMNNRFTYYINCYSPKSLSNFESNVHESI